MLAVTAGSLWCAAFAVMAVCVVSGNILTLATYVKNRHLRKRSMFLIINLSAVDLLVGLIPLPMHVYYVGGDYSLWLITDSARNWYKLFDMWFGFASVLNLVFISFERMHATTRPLRHRNTSSRMYGYVIVSAWLVPFLLALSTVLSFKSFYSIYWISTIAMFLFLIMIIAAYITIFVSIKKQRLPADSLGMGNQLRDHRDRKLALTLLIVTILSLVAWLPFRIIDLIIFLYSCGYYMQLPLIFNGVSGTNLIYSAKLLQYANSSINPVIYAIRMTVFRRALRRLMCSCARDNHARDNHARDHEHGQHHEIPLVPIAH